MRRKESYSDIILRHFKEPEYRREIANPTIQKTLSNTLCGDEVSLYINLTNDDIIGDISYQAKGCMICRASASILCHTVKGITTEEALTHVQNVKNLLKSEEPVQIDENDDREYLALLDVRKYPGRKKCALLAWRTFDEAISEHKQAQ